MYGSGAFGEALPIFNRFAIGLLPGDPARWRALLRDLQCRTELGHAPKDVLKVIDQQRRLHPDMGGPALAAAFDRLYLENQRRRDGG
jgi:hypothetical protein